MMAKATKKQTAFKHEPIAVIGLACVFPQAPDAESFWHNILNGVNAICDPAESWEAQRYLDSGRITTAKGGYLRDLFRFNPAEFGIMPSSVDGGEPDQLLALQAAKRALEDAGARYLERDFDHTDTGIVLGHSTYYHRGQINAAQHNICLDQTMDILKAALPGLGTEQEDKIREHLRGQLPPFNADMCPSEVPNVMTGRIANRLNFTGPNYLIDAACASSLLAVNAAIEELRSGHSRMMLAGGVNASLPAEVSVIFTLLDALSRRGSVRPFEEGSDGTLLGEGLGIVVLKRLSDAQKDGDKIYALVHGVGQSSDGRGLGLLAPSERGETLAVKRAYEAAGIDPASIGLIEAHGTGIPLGDKTEIATLKSVLGPRKGEQGSVAIGSVKSMISHCIPAAGMASFIKMCLSLHHKVLPPTLCDKVNPELGIGETPLYVNNTLRPWIAKPGEKRRAAINSFGFGGVNAHAILEEAPDEAKKPLKCSPWPAELFVFAGDGADDLKEQIVRLQTCLQYRTDHRLSDLAFTLSEEAADKKGSHKLALIAESRADLEKKIGQAFSILEKNKPVLGKGGVLYSTAPITGKMAFMFPGEGSQYMNMLSDLAVHFACVREWFDLWHATYETAPGENRTDLVFPPHSELTDERRKIIDERLHRMDAGSEAVFIAGQAMFSLLDSLGVRPDAMVGHSSGESSALVASRAIAWKTPEDMAGFIRKLSAVSDDLSQKGQIKTGALMAIGLMDKNTIREQVAGTTVMVAMENCPTQTIVFGGKDDVEKLAALLAEKGAICEILPFDRGYHTPYFEPMKKGFDKYYKDINLGVPQIPLYSCASASLFSDDIDGVRKLAADQWMQTVRFSDTIEAMYDDGVRAFIEVGPGGKLASFAEQILRGKDALTATGNLETRPGMAQFLNLLGKLYVCGKAGTQALFMDRAVRKLDLDDLAQKRLAGIILDNTMPRFHATPDLVKLLQQDGAIHAQPAAANDPYPDHRPFFTDIRECGNGRFSGLARLDLAEDRFLQDHVLSGPVSSVDPALRGLSCVPLMVALEIMAEGCAALAGRIDLTLIEDVATYDWIALDDGTITLDIRAEADADKPGRYRASIFNGGKKAVGALFTFGDQSTYRCAPAAPLSGQTWGNRWPEDYEIYSIGMYHGPIFQSIPRIAWNDQGVDAALSPVSLYGFFRDGETPCTILNPVLMDAVSQLPAFWIAQDVGTDFSCFPTRIDRIELYAGQPENEDGLTLAARKGGEPSHHAEQKWDFECADAQGAVLFRVAGFRNVYYPVPHTYYQCRYNPLGGWYGHPVESGGGVLQWHVPMLPEDFLAQSGGLFQRVIAHCTLGRDERAAWQDLEASLTEKSLWLFRRIAVKEAARSWIYEQTGELLHPSDIQVDFDSTGNAHIYGWWCGQDYCPMPPAIAVRNGDREVVVTIAAEQPDIKIAAE